MDFAWVVHDDDLRLERLADLRGVVFCVTDHHASLQIFGADVLDVEPYRVAGLRILQIVVEHLDALDL